MPLCAYYPNADCRERKRQNEIESRYCAVREERESRHAKKENRHRSAKRPAIGPSERNRRSMKCGRRSENRQQNIPAHIVFCRTRQRNEEQHAGKFQRTQVDRFKDIFEHARVRLENLHEEMREYQRPRENP